MLQQPLYSRNINFYLCITACSLFVGLYVELSRRLIVLTQDRSWGFRAGLFGVVLLSKLLLVLRQRISKRGEQLSSLQRQTNLPFILLTIPALLKLGLYIGCIQLPTLTNTPLFAAIVFVNVVLLELRNHYLLYQRKRTFRVQLEKCIGLLFLTIALVLCSYGHHSNSDNVLFWGLLVLATVLLQSYLYNTKALFDLYKPTVEEMLVKQFAMEVIIMAVVGVVVAAVGGLIYSEHMQAYLIAVQNEVVSCGNEGSLLIYAASVWLLFPVLELCLMECLRHLPTNEWFFTVISFVGWYNIIQLSHRQFGVLMFTAEFLFAVALISYFKMVRLKHMIGFANLLTRRDASRPVPIPLH